MGKLAKDIKSVKVWLAAFCCVALWAGKLTPLYFSTTVLGCIGARVVNQQKFGSVLDDVQKDSA